MPALLEALLALIGLVLAYAWISLPALRPYSLQLTSILFVLFFLSKRLKKSRWHEILPRSETFEATFLVGAVALAVGYSGGLDSPFLPLFYILLFLTALSLRLTTNIVELFGISVFLWATSSQPFTRESWAALLAFPFLLPLLAFARMQFDQANEEKCLRLVEERTLDTEEKRVATFLLEFTVPKLRAIRDILRVSPDNSEIAARQIILLEDESIKLLNSLEAEAKARETTDKNRILRKKGVEGSDPGT